MPGLNKVKHVVLLGAYATGTNYVSSTLKESGLRIANYPSPEEAGRQARHFFKHYVIEPDTLDVLKPSATALFVCLVKDPYHWMKSLRAMVEARIVPAREMSRLRDVELAEFIRSPGTMVGARRESGPGEQARIRYSHLPDFWNRYVRGYTQCLPPDRTLILRYEDTLFNPCETFGAVMARAGLPGAAVRVSNKRRFQSRNSTGIGRNHDEAIRYYSRPEERLHGFGPEDRSFMEIELDHDLTRQFGYG